LRREHRPHYLRLARATLEARYARHFLEPHFDAVGEGTAFGNPWHISAHGPHIELGRYVKIDASTERPVRLVCWPIEPTATGIKIGDFAMINPGARFHCGDRIELGKNALLAPEVTLSDSDWHDPYDRVYTNGAHAPIILHDNVWVGEGARICKGVTIGENSIIGAGSVVTHDIDDDAIAAGNPARVIRRLDADREFISRDHVYAHPEAFFGELKRIEDTMLSHNTTLGYLRHLLFPKRTD